MENTLKIRIHCSKKTQILHSGVSVVTFPLLMMSFMRIGKLLNCLLDSPEPALSAIQEALILFDQLRETQLENLVVSCDNEIQNLMSRGSFKEPKETAEYVGVLAAFLKSPDLLSF